MPLDERRQSDRINYRILCEFRLADNIAAGFIFNLSGNGLFIRTEELGAVGQAIEVWVHADTIYKAVGKVLWLRHKPVNPRVGDPAGMGVVLTEPCEHHAALVQQLEQQCQNRSLLDKRFEIVQKVQFESGASLLSEYTENISRGGLYIATHEPLAIGTSIKTTLEIPGLSERIDIEGRVAHAVSADKAQEAGRRPGVGIQFVNLSERAKAILFHFIKRIEIHRHTPSRRQQNLPDHGSLTEYLVPEILLACADSKLTGTLHLERYGVSKNVYFQAGNPSFVDSHVRSEMFCHYLVKRGLLSESELHSLLQDIEGTHLRFGEFLAQKGMLDTKVLHDLLVEHQEDKIMSTFPWFDGTFSIVRDSQWPQNVSFLPLETSRIIFSGISEYYSPEALQAWMGLDEGTLVKASDLNSSLVVPNIVFAMCRTLKSPLTLGELSKEINLSIGQVIQHCFGGILTGLLAITKERSLVSSASEATPTAPVLNAATENLRLFKAKLERDYLRFQSKDFFMILGVSPTDSESVIRGKYLSLMTSYHLGSVENTDDPEIREQFQKVARLLRLAYDTLINPDLRKVYSMRGLAHGSDPQRLDRIRIERGLFQSIRHLDKQEYAQAYEVLAALHDIYPSDSSVKGYLAWSMFLLKGEGQHETARCMLDEALANDVTDAQLFYYSGKMYAQRNSWMQAEAMFQQALRLNPQFEQAEAEYERARNHTATGGDGRSRTGE